LFSSSQVTNLGDPLGRIKYFEKIDRNTYSHVSSNDDAFAGSEAGSTVIVFNPNGFTHEIRFDNKICHSPSFVLMDNQ